MVIYASMLKNDSLHETLKWLNEIGVDEGMADVPQKRLLNDQRPQTDQQKLSPQPRPLAQSMSIRGTSAPTETISTLSELQQAVESFDKCPLKKTAINTVFSDGIPDARIMIIGEAPGADEDRQGKPFVGMSGQLLDAFFNAAGFTRQKNLYITNIVPWRPPGNRQPTTNEIALCLPFVLRHIELINPDFLILAGSISAKAILNTTEGITRLRGRWFTHPVQGRLIEAMPIYHPAFLLRSPSRKKEVWFDLLALKEKYETRYPPTNMNQS